MKIISTDLAGVVIIEPTTFFDDRGSFHESFRVDRYAEHGLVHAFVQDNVSVSREGVLRGLHFQHPNGQAKLVQALRGEVFDVAVDVRVGSPTFGRAVWAVLSQDNFRQLLIPPGFAHGFAVTSGEAVVAYKCSAYYSPASEITIRWNDPALAIPWPLRNPLVSARDAAGALLRDIPFDDLPNM